MLDLEDAMMEGGNTNESQIVEAPQINSTEDAIKKNQEDEAKQDKTEEENKKEDDAKADEVREQVIEEPP